MEGVRKGRMPAPTRPFRGVLAVTTTGPISDAEKRAFRDWENAGRRLDEDLLRSFDGIEPRTDGLLSYVIVRALRAGVKLEDLL